MTLPSGADMEAYIGTYPNMQANIISDENGYYVVDLIETSGREKPNVGRGQSDYGVVTYIRFFKNRIINLGL